MKQKNSTTIYIEIRIIQIYSQKRNENTQQKFERMYNLLD